MGDATIEDIPYEIWVKDVSPNYGTGRSNLPNVSLPSGIRLSPADPYSTDKTYEVSRDIRYDTKNLPADSDLTVIASRGKNPKTLASATLTYTEVSATYVGTNGKYYVATSNKFYVDKDKNQFNKKYDGPYLDTMGTLSIPGTRIYSEDFQTVGTSDQRLRLRRDGGLIALASPRRASGDRFRGIVTALSAVWRILGRVVLTSSAFAAPGTGCRARTA